jgi:uncharacterized protein YjbI with pentapeptide repeats
MLTEKTKRYDQALYDPGRNVTDTTRKHLQWQLPGNVFIQLLAGPEPKNRREIAFRWLLWSIAWVTLLIAPVLLLLLLQIQFLPFHWSALTWIHRILLLADIGFVWWLWSMILSGREKKGRRARWAGSFVGLLLTACALIFSTMIATFPGESHDNQLAAWRLFSTTDPNGHPTRVSLHDWIFNGPFDQSTGRRRSALSATLILPALNIYDGLKIDDPAKTGWRQYVFVAGHRDLRGAIFDNAILTKVDLTGADLQGASLVHAQLQGAAWRNAKLQGAQLGFAQLQGGILAFAKLQGASLVDAELQGAVLTDAQLKGAELGDIKLQGASLEGAQLQGASLLNAQLQGAWLLGAQFQGAGLSNARLQGASLEGAALEATDLSATYLWRTNLKTQSKLTSVRMSGNETWGPVWGYMTGFGYMNMKPQLWDSKAYNALLTTMEALTLGYARDNALEHITVLDCTSPNPILASCDPNIAPPCEAAAWQKAVEAARVDDEVYAKALAGVLKGLVCSGNDDARYVARGEGFKAQLFVARAAAINLIDDMINKDSKNCPVAVALTNDDRAKLLAIKQDIEKTGK